MLKDFTLKIKKDEIVSLLGNNGSGKTTLINILVGIIKADSGSVNIYGHSLEKELHSCRRNIRLC